MTALAALGDVESMALPGENYKLAFTPGLLGLYSSKIPLPALTLILQDEGKYVNLDGDGQWWVPAGRMFYSSNEADSPTQELKKATEHFFLPRRYRDPFGHDTTLDYDGPVDPALPRYDLLVARTEDAMKNVVLAEHDYRLLQPRRMTDANGNHSAVAFDALGMVVVTAVIGKNGEGDRLEGFNADLTQAELDSFFTVPRPPNRALLGKAGTRIIYDVDRYARTGKPAYAAMLGRETHASDPGGATSTIQVSFSYSDGFGREIQKKIQAEAGSITPGGASINPRWVGSGWTIFNNKSKPVRQYEPFFSATHDFEFAKTVGVSPILFYDPVGRVVATLRPNHTYEKVLFDPWQQTSYDVNDTVKSDPSADEDVKGFFLNPDGTDRLPPVEFLPTWHALRTDPAHAAEATRRWPDPKIRDAEKSAAQKAQVHENTPTVTHFDTLGRAFLTIAHNKFERRKPDGTLEMVEEKYPTRIHLDIEDNQREVRDAINQNGDVEGRVVMRYDYDLLGQLIRQVSMEAGSRWMLANVAGKPIRAWDSRNLTRRMTYDGLQRLTGLFVAEPPGERLAEETIYGESKTTPEVTNHRGRVWQAHDDAGNVTSETYDFKGNLLSSRRDLRTEYKTPVNWALPAAPAMSESFTSSTKFDALGRVIEAIAPDGSVTHPRYNEANLLDGVNVLLPGAAEARPFVSNINYDAKGQRELIAYDNGAQTTYQYDPLTFRLIKLATTRPANPDHTASQLFNNLTLVQDLRYTYDPAGNITRIEDAAPKTIIHNGEQVEPVCEYIYDASYRLIEAKGREHIGQTTHDFVPADSNRRDYPFLGLRAQPSDPQAVRNYTERYEYDAVGNFEIMRHVANGGEWTRRYEYSEPSLTEPGKQSNRLTKTIVGNGSTFTETYTYKDALGTDSHGCMTAINSMKMRWDFEDQLAQVDLQGGGTAYYVYDAAGKRTRKVIERNGATMEERIYVGGFEVYRKKQGGVVQLARKTFHVMDDKQRIAMVETRTVDIAGSDPGLPLLIRYQLGNHLGSASLELDHQAQVISYEEYHPYGTSAFQSARSQTETPKRYRYTGKERDEETGLCYHGNRYYLPWLARWPNPDPKGTIDGVNRYRCCRGNPVTFTDPTGTESTPLKEQVYKGLRKDLNLGADRSLGPLSQTKPNIEVLTPQARNAAQQSPQPVVIDPACRPLTPQGRPLASDPLPADPPSSGSDFSLPKPLEFGSVNNRGTLDVTDLSLSYKKIEDGSNTTLKGGAELSMETKRGEVSQKITWDYSKLTMEARVRIGIGNEFYLRGNTEGEFHLGITHGSPKASPQQLEESQDTVSKGLEAAGKSGSNLEDVTKIPKGVRPFARLLPERDETGKENAGEYKPTPDEPATPKILKPAWSVDIYGKPYTLKDFADAEINAYQTGLTLSHSF